MDQNEVNDLMEQNEAADLMDEDEAVEQMEQNRAAEQMDQDEADDLMLILSQFMLMVSQLLNMYPELFGLKNTSMSQVAISSWSALTQTLRQWDEEEDEDLANLLVARNLSLRWLVHDDLDNYVERDQWWVKPRSTAWFYDFLINYYGDDRWLENMRMTRNSFLDLCNILGPSIIKQDTNYRKAIPVFARVGAALYKLVSGLGFLKVSESFAMGKTSAKRVLREVCALVGERMGHLISFPTGQGLVEVMHAFYDQCGLPNVAGAIDGTHITIKAPNTVFYRDYYKKNKYSMCLQAVCDTSWRFRDIYVGMPGSVNDTRALKYSSLWRRCCDHALLNDDPLALPWGVDIRPFLLGDLGYPVMSWLLIPVRHLAADAVLTREEQHFNSRHRRGRRHVEQTFGLLKKVFWEMGQPTELGVEILPFVVRACCILQNFMIEKQENDFLQVLQAWELEVAAAEAEGVQDDQQMNVAEQGREGGGNLVAEELARLQSTRALVAYLNRMR